MGEIEGIGEAVIGGAVAAAVEPATGAIDGDGHTQEAACLNCSTPLLSDYCHSCGQRRHIHRTLRAFFHDLLHGLLHFEGKVWNTLPLLVWRPGELTHRYIDGERARFVSPIALFLFSVFLIFAAVSLFGGLGDLPSQAKQGLHEELRVNQQKLATLEAKREVARKASQPTAKLNERIGDVRDEINAIEAVRKGDLSGAGVKSSGVPGWIGNSVGKAARNPELVGYKLKTNAYKFSWMIIPLSVPFVWMLFPFRRRYRLYDHTIFVTYSLCFMSLLLVLGLMLGAAGWTSLADLLWLIPPFHMYRQLKGAYSVGRAGALWRTTLLLIFASIVLGLFSAVLVGMGTFD
ncbi:MAG: DUF3667 domain-containing protein [Sphingomicrobium sp.]